MIAAIIAIAFSRLVDGDEIFARARQVWATQNVPSYLEYTVTTIASRAGRSETNHYAAACYCEKHELFVDKISDEQVAHPPAPHGVTENVVITIYGARVIAKTFNPEPLADPIGVPLLSPLYSFGMQLPSAEPAIDEKTKLPIIATTSTAVRHYTITLAGDEEIDGRSAYHLVLQPLSLPHTYRIRDLWIDEGSFNTMQARIAANFDNDWFNDQSWTIHFSDDVGFEHIAYEESDGPVTLRGHTYDTVRISFDGISAPQTRSKKFWLQTPAYDPLSEP